MASWVHKSLPKAPPILGTIPAFELTNQHGMTFTSKDLEGRAWVANFIFTRCTTVCPMFSAKMSRIQHRARGLWNSVKLVSISVDPEYDTPERLLAYAKSHKASPFTWSFLTGPIENIKKVVIEGLKVSMGNEGPEGNFEGIFHGSHFVVVDSKMRIRGYFDANESDAIDKVLYNLGLILNMPHVVPEIAANPQHAGL
jgi:protein SCO1/2